MFLKVKEDSGRMLEYMLGRFKRKQLSQLRELNSDNLKVMTQFLDKIIERVEKGMTEVTRKMEKRIMEVPEDLQEVRKCQKGRVKD